MSAFGGSFGRAYTLAGQIKEQYNRGQLSTCLKIFII